MAWPIWVPNIAPPMLRIICCSGRGQRGRLLGHRAELGHRAALAGEHRAHRVDDLAGHRVDQLAPRRQRRLDPLGAAPGLHRDVPAGNAVASSSHRLRQPHRVEHLLALGGGHRPVARRGHGLPGHVAGEVPVHRAALVRQQLPEPGERRADVAAAAHQRRERVGRLAAGTGAPGSSSSSGDPGLKPKGKLLTSRLTSVGRPVGPGATGLAGWAHHDRCASHRSHRVQ